MKRGDVSAADSCEQLHPPGEGTQFTPFGLFGLDQSTPAANGDAQGAAIPEPERTKGPPRRESPAEIRRALATPTPIDVPRRAAIDASPRGVVKAAKARAKAIKAELRNMKALQKELAELERLIAAAKKPQAAARDIRRSAH